eukprot:3105861-Prymnesium_polylepis.1
MLLRRLRHRRPVAMGHLSLPPLVMRSTPRPSKRPWWRRWAKTGLDTGNDKSNRQKKSDERNLRGRLPRRMASAARPE